MSARVNVKYLRITLFAGLILLVLSGTILTIFYLTERNANAVTRQKDNFHRIMREFDAGFDGLFFTESEFTRLNGDLDRMEKTAVTVESWLSILKRRRALAKIHAASAVNYNQTIENALKAYPASQAIALIAASSSEDKERIRQLLAQITEPNFNSARLSLHVLLGDFENPASAALIPENLHSDKIESIAVDLALIKVLRRDYRGASSDIQIMLNEIHDESESASLSSSALRFAAEYHYDFGNPLRSAEIFSYLDDEKAMSRQADALYLAGYSGSAAALWNILADLLNETSLYNLAVISDDRAASSQYLEKLVNITQVTNEYSKARQFGLILYSRLLNNSAAVSLLQKKIENQTLIYPYIDLEICKRGAQGQNPGRQIAETWFLLDRHENNEDIFNWALWNMFFQRDFDEAKILLDRMNQKQFDYHWLNFYKALFSMRNGSLDEADNFLRSIPEEYSSWLINVNLGRILEAARSPRGALEQYQLAAEKIEQKPSNFKTASIIQTRIARCYAALHRPNDVLRSLQFALDYDPGNLAAQLELDRFLGVID